MHSLKEQCSIRFTRTFIFWTAKKDSILDIEIEVDKLLGDDDECPYCNRTGKLNKPGALDCPHCKGSGVMEFPLHVYLNNRADRLKKNQNNS